MQSISSLAWHQHAALSLQRTQKALPKQSSEGSVGVWLWIGHCTVNDFLAKIYNNLHYFVHPTHQLSFPNMSRQDHLRFVRTSICEYLWASPNHEIGWPSTILAQSPNLVAASDKDDEEQRTTLHSALVASFPVSSRRRESSVIRRLLETCPQAASVLDAKRRSPLQYAIERTFSDYHERSDKGLAEILFAAYPGAASIVDDQGRTPLHYACIGDWLVPERLELIKKLVKQYPDAAAIKDSSHSTPLRNECKKFRCCPNSDCQNLVEDVILELLHHNPSARDVRDEDGVVPLYVMLGLGDKTPSVKLVQKMLPSKALSKVVDSNGRTLLHKACITWAWRDDDISNRKAIVDILLDYDQDCCLLRDITGCTIFHYLCQRVYSAFVEHAISSMIQRIPHAAQVLDTVDCTPFHYACASLNFSVQLLQIVIDAWPAACLLHNSRGQLAYDMIQGHGDSKRKVKVAKVTMQDTTAFLECVFTPLSKVESSINRPLSRPHPSCCIALTAMVCHCGRHVVVG